MTLPFATVHIISLNIQLLQNIVILDILPSVFDMDVCPAVSGILGDDSWVNFIHLSGDRLLAMFD